MRAASCTRLVRDASLGRASWVVLDGAVVVLTALLVVPLAAWLGAVASMMGGSWRSADEGFQMLMELPKRTDNF